MAQSVITILSFLSVELKRNNACYKKYRVNNVAKIEILKEKKNNNSRSSQHCTSYIIEDKEGEEINRQEYNEKKPTNYILCIRRIRIGKPAKNTDC